MHAGDNVHVVDLRCTVVKVRDLKIIRGETSEVLDHLIVLL